MADQVDGMFLESNNPVSVSSSCQLHGHEILTKFCITCNAIMCDVCRTDTHMLHEQVDIHQMAENIRHEMTERTKKMRTTELCELSKTLKAIQANKAEYSKHTAYVRLEITDKTKILKTELDRVSDSLLQDLAIQEREDMSVLTSLASELLQRQDSVTKFLATYDAKLERSDDLELIQFFRKSEALMLDLETPIQFCDISPPVFVSTDSVNRSSIAKLYGYLDSDKESVTRASEGLVDLTVNPTVNIRIGKIVNFDQLENDAVYSIRTLPNGNVWLGTGIQTIQLINKMGDILKERQLSFYPYNITILQNGTLLLSNGESVRKMMPDGEATTFFHAAPFFSQGMCTTYSGDVLICLAKRDSGKILRLNSDGITLQKIQFDKSGKQLYINPTKVAENPTNLDICVQDSGHNCVVVVNKNGDKRFTYHGLPDDTNFSPFYIVCDSFGNILVGDNTDFRIHLLNESGKFLQFILTMDDGLRSPWGMDIDDEKKLWVGTLSGKIWIIEYIE